MESMKDPRLNDAVESALTAGKGALRGKAIHLLAGRPDASSRLELLLSNGSTSDQQAVLVTLGTIEQPAAEQILSAWLDKLAAGSVPPELQLDLLEAAAKSKSDALKAKVKQFDEKREAAAKDNPLAAFGESLLGGDAGAGKKIFIERQDVSCLRCHKLDGQGGVAGPDLTGVASRHERKFLLEALINPNAQIAPGFESVTVKMKAGRNYAGVVKSDTDAEVVIDAGDGATVHLDKKEVASRTKGLSPMPQDISKTLSKRDVRDLVEFLSTLRQPTTQIATTAPTTAPTTQQARGP
jgi:quinoprotein glucose dehydrogenase